MAYEWRLFWVGDGGNAAGSRPVPDWEDLEERERALGLRERQPILVSPDGRVTHAALEQQLAAREGVPDLASRRQPRP